MRRRGLGLAIGLLAICSAGAGWAQQPRRGPSGDPASADLDVVLATASEWGGAQGVYTCDEWRRYLKRMYNLADRRRRGFIDATDFEIVRRVSLVFKAASFDYFDVAGTGRVAQKDFLAFPSPFFARFDKKKTCRVTQEDIRQAKTPAAPPPSVEPGRGGRGGGPGGGFGAGGFGAGGFGR